VADRSERPLWVESRPSARAKARQRNQVADPADRRGSAPPANGGDTRTYGRAAPASATQRLTPAAVREARSDPAASTTRAPAIAPSGPRRRPYASLAARSRGYDRRRASIGTSGARRRGCGSRLDLDRYHLTSTPRSRSAAPAGDRTRAFPGLDPGIEPANPGPRDPALDHGSAPLRPAPESSTRPAEPPRCGLGPRSAPHCKP
jgi:hypothetical protein